LNARERFLEVVGFGNPDRIPLSLGGVRPMTMEAWIAQGFPKGANVPEYLGFDHCTVKSRGFTSYPGEGFEWKPSPSSVNLGPIPPFKHRLLSQDDRHRVWVDALGITQKGFRSDWEDGWSGFATRVFMEFPVKDRSDFEKIKKRYDPHDPKRYPRNWDEMARSHRGHDYPLQVGMRGPFWWTRDMTGLRKIATGIHREPALIKDIMDFCAEFHIGVLERALDSVDVDYVVMSEDMAYRDRPMIGPATMEEFMGPAYKRIVEFFKARGVKLIAIDSDGNSEPLIPVWLKLSIEGITPCEVNAGMDVVKLAEKYPKLVMMGGIDKTRLARGRDAIRREVMYKVPPLVKRGGYLPGVDHAVPPDISLENFAYFADLLKRLCGW
jgi:uroporphyrinogen decarboxylase